MDKYEIEVLKYGKVQIYERLFPDKKNKVLVGVCLTEEIAKMAVTAIMEVKTPYSWKPDPENSDYARVTHTMVSGTDLFNQSLQHGVSEKKGIFPKAIAFFRSIRLRDKFLMAMILRERVVGRSSSQMHFGVDMASAEKAVAALMAAGFSTQQTADAMTNLGRKLKEDKMERRSFSVAEINGDEVHVVLTGVSGSLVIDA